jgi:hypothetical protein
MSASQPTKIELFYESGLVCHTGIKVSRGTAFFIADFDPNVVGETADFNLNASMGVVTSDRLLSNPKFFVVSNSVRAESMDNIRDILTRIQTGDHNINLLL